MLLPSWWPVALQSKKILKSGEVKKGNSPAHAQAQMWSNGRVPGKWAGGVWWQDDSPSSQTPGLNVSPGEMVFRLLE